MKISIQETKEKRKENKGSKKFLHQGFHIKRSRGKMMCENFGGKVGGKVGGIKKNENLNTGNEREKKGEQEEQKIFAPRISHQKISR
jgi:hypothetical protein